ncbi:hypothetical protein ISS39_08200 [Candidatus Bathyarchaeota archaeon]|nr:hypothetical protein [Candidatus Bathyarchaeota archaeon]
MKQKPLEVEPGCEPDVEALRLEVEKLKREEERIRLLRQKKEHQLRTIIFRKEMTQ